MPFHSKPLRLERNEHLEALRLRPKSLVLLEPCHRATQ